MGTPRRAVLKRVCRSCFEPRRGRDPTGGLFVRKPTASGGRAFWRPPAGPRDATSRGRASASHPHSGQSVRVAKTGGQESDDGALLALFDAIASGDYLEIERRLDSSRGLASCPIHTGASRQDAETYFLAAIRHYVYAGDTALHIAAAAHQRGL